MSRTHVSSLALVVGGTPADIDLAVHGDMMCLRLADGVTLHLDDAAPETLARIATLLNRAASIKTSRTLRAVS